MAPSDAIATRATKPPRMMRRCSLRSTACAIASHSERARLLLVATMRSSIQRPGVRATLSATLRRSKATAISADVGARRHVPVAAVRPSRTFAHVGRARDAHAVPLQLCAPLVLVEPRRVLAEDHLLDAAVRVTQRREPVLALHVLGNLETAQRLDLPLRRTGPDGVGAPDDVIGTESLDELPHHRCAQTRLRHGALREDLSEIAVDVGHAVLRGNLGEVGHPVDAAAAVELLDAFLVCAAGEAERRVVDDEVELRPVLRG